MLFFCPVHSIPSGATSSTRDCKYVCTEIRCFDVLRNNAERCQKNSTVVALLKDMRRIVHTTMTGCERALGPMSKMGLEI